MDMALVDARQWQNLLDFRTGEKCGWDNHLTRMARSILKHNPYPGDMREESLNWVTDTALELLEAYRPRLACLSYAGQYFIQRVEQRTEKEIADLLAKVLSEAERFVRESGFTPVFVGTGDMTELKEEIDLSMLDGIVSESGGSGSYIGLREPSENDLAYLADLPGIERIVRRDEWIRLFTDGGSSCQRIPDFLVVAREGWRIRSAGSSARRTIRLPGRNKTIPVSTPLGVIGSLTDIRELILTNLDRTPIALIILEGIGRRHFPLPCHECANGREWYCYEPGEGQYLSMTTGRHQLFAYPPGYRSSDEVMGQRLFPFSGHFRDIPEHTLGEDFSGRSIAVGNRSMFTHMVFGADISIECFARNLFNQGCITVVRDKAMRKFHQEKVLPLFRYRHSA